MDPRDHHQSVQLGAGVYIVSPDGKLLLIEQERDGSAMWGALGGGVQRDETVEDAALREAYEESGLRVRLTQLLTVDQIWVNGAFEFISFSFCAEPDPWPQDVVMPETDGSTKFLRYGWFARGEIAAIENIWDDDVCRLCWPPDVTSPRLRTLHWND